MSGTMPGPDLPRATNDGPSLVKGKSWNAMVDAVRSIGARSVGTPGMAVSRGPGGTTEYDSRTPGIWARIKSGDSANGYTWEEVHRDGAVWEGTGVTGNTANDVAREVNERTVPPGSIVWMTRRGTAQEGGWLFFFRTVEDPQPEECSWVFRVLACNNLPLRWARVTVIRRGTIGDVDCNTVDPPSPQTWEGFTNSDGEYQVLLPPGNYLVRASAGSFQNALFCLDLTCQTIDRTVTFILDPPNQGQVCAGCCAYPVPISLWMTSEGMGNIGYAGLGPNFSFTGTFEMRFGKIGIVASLDPCCPVDADGCPEGSYEERYGWVACQSIPAYSPCGQGKHVVFMDLDCNLYYGADSGRGCRNSYAEEVALSSPVSAYDSCAYMVDDPFWIQATGSTQLPFWFVELLFCKVVPTVPNPNFPDVTLKPKCGSPINPVTGQRERFAWQVMTLGYSNDNQDCLLSTNCDEPTLRSFDNCSPPFACFPRLQLHTFGLSVTGGQFPYTVITE